MTNLLVLQRLMAPAEIPGSSVLQRLVAPAGNPSMRSIRQLIRGMRCINKTGHLHKLSSRLRYIPWNKFRLWVIELFSRIVVNKFSPKIRHGWIKLIAALLCLRKYANRWYTVSICPSRGAALNADKSETSNRMSNPAQFAAPTQDPDHLLVSRDQSRHQQW